MIKFFRKIRQSLLSEGKTTKYFKYALGEIILVVIGILIALQINNWNENQKSKKRLDDIYSTIEQNLITDLVNIKEPIEFYERLDSTLTKILTTTYPISFLDSINEDNYLECIPCKSNINRYSSFEKQDNGIELLKKYEDDKSIEGTDLTQEIIQFYTKQGNELSYFIDFITNETYTNLKSYEQFPWYADYSINKYNAEAVAYFLNDQNYKNKAANFKIFIGRNYLSMLKAYKKLAAEIITKIKKRRQ
ncbi:MAG: DUF6090 family protein [Winogradskyella sp.]|nr:DUF6090 family protein [Winogradskyella sp.]